MTEKPTQSTATLWARFRFSVIGSLLSAPLRAENSNQPSNRWPKKSGRIRSPDRMCSMPPPRSNVGTTRRETNRRIRFGCCSALSAKIRGKVSVGLEAYRASAHAVPRPSALELPTALRQPGKCRERRPFARAAMLLLHRKTFHADPWDDAQATAAKRSPGRRACSPPP